MGFLKFAKVGTSLSKKTDRYQVENNSGEILGWISWFSAWRSYCFSPKESAIYDSKSLREITHKCEELTDFHKEKWD